MIFSVALFVGVVSATLCANDCANVTSHVVCFNGTSCGSGKPGQFDFFAFSQISLIQYCSALTRNYDPTARNASRRCAPHAKLSPILSIHGLWPNYFHGYPQCCSNAQPFSSGPVASPGSFDPEIDAPALFARLLRVWSDPAATDACGQMWNHEYLKHATCMLRPLDPRWFLNVTLALRDFLAPRTMAVERVRVAAQGALIDESLIRGLYPRAVQIVCDPSARPTPQLVELRTCWSVSQLTGEPEQQIDCTPDRFECPKQFFIP